MRYGSGCVPAARSWKSVRFPPNEFVDTTACERNRFSQIGHARSICCSVVMVHLQPPCCVLLPGSKGKNCATLYSRSRLFAFAVRATRSPDALGALGRPWPDARADAAMHVAHARHMAPNTLVPLSGHHYH